MIGETGCCGFSMEEKGPNLFGLLTLAIPLLLLSVTALPLLYLAGKFIPACERFRKIILVVILAVLNLIHKKQIFPLYRCRIAGTLFNVSPMFSGMVYRSFNLTLFLLIWIGLLIPVMVWLK